MYPAFDMLFNFCCLRLFQGKSRTLRLLKLSSANIALAKVVRENSRMRLDAYAPLKANWYTSMATTITGRQTSFSWGAHTMSEVSKISKCMG